MYHEKKKKKIIITFTLAFGSCYLVRIELFLDSAPRSPVLRISESNLDFFFFITFTLSTNV